MNQWIVFEGGEGSGKTTLMEALQKELVSRGISCLSTREPGGVPISEAIRQIVLDPENTALDPITEALLFAASRRQHLVEKVLPALVQNKTVLMDRYIDSSLVYQGYARGIGVDAVRRVNEWATEGHLPDIVFLLDIAPEVGLERVSELRGTFNRIDLETLRFHEKVREGYLRLAKDNPRMVVLDANKDMDALLHEMLEILFP